MKVQCCVCKKIRRDAGWGTTTAEELFDPRASHGYCPECAEKAFGELRRGRRKPETTAKSS